MMQKYTRLLKPLSNYKKIDRIVKKEQVVNSSFNSKDDNKLPYNDFLKIYRWHNTIYLK